MGYSVWMGTKPPKHPIWDVTYPTNPSIQLTSKACVLNAGFVYHNLTRPQTEFEPHMLTVGLSLPWFYHVLPPWKSLNIFEKPRCLQSQLLQLLKFLVSPAFPRLFGFLFSTSMVALCSIQLSLGLMTSTRLLNHTENHGKSWKPSTGDHLWFSLLYNIMWLHGTLSFHTNLWMLI